MSLKRYLQKIRFIDHLISRKSTGCQKALAGKTGMSISTLNEYLHEMKEMGFPIKYCRKTQTYYYEKHGCMVKKLFTEQLSKDEMKKVTGGYIPFAKRENVQFLLKVV